MSREKQIESTDWLTKGYSEEELARIKAEAIKEADAELRDKQIEEMARELCDATQKTNQGCNSICYKKQCPFCKSIVTGYELNNAICKCGAKYYCLSDTWLQRKGAKEVRGNLWHK